MSETLEARVETEYRAEIVGKVRELPEEQQERFMRIFARGNEDVPMEDLVAVLPKENLSSIMALVDRTIRANRLKEIEPTTM